jgi:hypothetical protein
MKEPFAEFKTYYKICHSPAKNPAATDVKNKALTRTFAKIREVIAYNYNKPGLPDTVILEAGLKIGGGEHTPVVVPDTSPDLSVDSSVIRRLGIHYRVAGHKREGKPDHVYAMVLDWAMLDHPPASLPELTNHVTDTYPPIVLEFGEEDRGKKVYMAGSWQIAREGEKGPPRRSSWR